MSKITVTTIAGATSGADANKVKIESGDELNVVNGDLTVNTNKLFVDASTDLIGIGTTSPATATGGGIDIHRNGGSSVRIDDTTNSVTGELQVYSAGLNLATVTNHNLVLSTNNSAKMIIDGSGRVTMPSQPCFSATATTTNIPLTTQTTITLSSERFDVGGNLANNTFTAPVSGKYLFTFMFYFSNLDAGHTTLDTHIKTSNKQYQMTWRPSVFMNSDGNFSASGSVIADMDTNDTCYFTTYVSGGAAQTDIHGDSQVSGCLLL